MELTRLEALQIQSCSQASEALQRGNPVRQGYSRVAVVLQPQGRDCCCCCCLEIPKGFQALITSNGSYIGQLGEGSTFQPLWIAVSHLVPERDIVFNQSIKECATKENAMVAIDISIKLRIITDDVKL